MPAPRCLAVAPATDEETSTEKSLELRNQRAAHLTSEPRPCGPYTPRCIRAFRQTWTVVTGRTRSPDLLSPFSAHPARHAARPNTAFLSWQWGPAAASMPWPCCGTSGSRPGARPLSPVLSQHLPAPLGPFLECRRTAQGQLSPQRPARVCEGGCPFQAGPGSILAKLTSPSLPFLGS